jgi:uncharacterized membrane protein YhaH (DUF805 family)
VSTPLELPAYGIGPVDAVQRYFRKYATFTGRASRSEYWWVVLFNFVVGLVLELLALLLGSVTSPDGQEPGWGFYPVAIVLLLFFLVSIVPGLALLVRRLHDINLAGWFALLILIPSIGGIVLLIMAILPPNPLGERFDR